MLMVYLVFRAFALTANRKMQEVNFAIIQFNYAVFSTFLMGIALIITCIHAKRIPFAFNHWWIYLELLCSICFSYLAQSFDIIISQFHNPATGQLLGYVSLVYMFLADWIFFTLEITFMQLAGILICVACSLAVVVYKMSRPEEAKD